MAQQAVRAVAADSTVREDRGQVRGREQAPVMQTMVAMVLRVVVMIVVAVAVAREQSVQSQTRPQIKEAQGELEWPMLPSIACFQWRVLPSQLILQAEVPGVHGTTATIWKMAAPVEVVQEVMPPASRPERQTQAVAVAASHMTILQLVMRAEVDRDLSLLSSPRQSSS